MKTEHMRASENVEDRRGLRQVSKAADLPEPDLSKYEREDDEIAKQMKERKPERGPPPAPPESHPGDDDIRNEHLLRPATRAATGYNEDYTKQKVKPIPALSLDNARARSWDENVPHLGYEKGGPVMGAKKIRNKGYRPF